MKYFLLFIYIFVTYACLGQLSNNHSLLNKGNKKLILDSVAWLKSQETSFTYSFKDKELQALNLYIIPLAKFRNSDAFSYNDSLINFIDFTNIDTLVQVILYKENPSIFVEGILSHTNQTFYFSPPLLNEGKNFKKITQLKLNEIFVFLLPTLHEWWILKDRNLFVLDQKKNKIVYADKYIRKKYNQKYFKNLMQNIILINNSENTIKTLKQLKKNE